MTCLDDDLATGFVAGSLPPAVREQVVSHVDSCDQCRRLVAEMARDGDGDAAAERYEMKEEVGRGAMGVVVRAYDRRLHREVAIKLTGRDHAEDELRFQREAQALARINHPNVVAVYDVFEREGRTCIAMEIVSGSPLGEWARPGRSWRAVCALMAQVGRGLAAVHDAGLVHRDIKPNNILVTAGGDAKIADFGLVRRRDAAAEARSDTDVLGVDLTVTGAVVGTPSYMAPEVLDGRASTARSDQYSFCITLYELLFGRRPFDGDTPAALREAAGGGPEFPRSALPRRLVAALRRGLAAHPEQRFDDMEALIRAIPEPRPPVRYAVVAAAVVAAAALGLVAVRAEREDPCRRGAGAVAAVWSERARRSVLVGLGGDGSPVAAATRRSLDDYAARWRDMFLSSCAASERGEQSAPHLDRRMQCLGRSRLALGATIDVLARADDRAVDGARDAVAALPPISDCGDFARLQQLIAMPAEPARRQAIEQAESQLARFTALKDAGQLDRASEIAQATLAQARASGYAPVLSRALLAAGQASAGREPIAAEAHLREAARVAAEAGDANSEARAWVELITVIGSEQGRVREALALEHAASVAIGRVGSTLSPGALHLALGGVHNINQDPDRAVEMYEKALPFAADDPARLAAIHNNLGSALAAAGKADDAFAHFEEAIAQYARSQHPGHVNIGVVLLNQGPILRRRGDLAGAGATLERARRIIEASAGAEGAVIARLAVEQAALSKALGKVDEADRAYQKALDTTRRVHGPQHVRAAYVAEDYAEFLTGQGRSARADELYDLSIQIQQAAYGADSPKLATSYANRATHHHQQGSLDPAIADYTRARDLGGDSPVATYAAIQLGHLARRQGRSRDALAALTDGIERAERTGGAAASHVAWARLQAADLLWRTRSSRARARDQATAALEAFRHLGDSERAAEAGSWLRSRGLKLPASAATSTSAGAKAAAPAAGAHSYSTVRDARKKGTSVLPAAAQSPASSPSQAR